jgi:hypothetical protein
MNFHKPDKDNKPILRRNRSRGKYSLEFIIISTAITKIKRDKLIKQILRSVADLRLGAAVSMKIKR